MPSAGSPLTDAVPKDGEVLVRPLRPLQASSAAVSEGRGPRGTSIYGPQSCLQAPPSSLPPAMIDRVTIIRRVPRELDRERLGDPTDLPDPFSHSLNWWKAPFSLLCGYGKVQRYSFKRAAAELATNLIACFRWDCITGPAAGLKEHAVQRRLEQGCRSLNLRIRAVRTCPHYGKLFARPHNEPRLGYLGEEFFSMQL